VNIHQNARTNPYSRALLVARLHGGWTAAAAATSFGISIRTVRKWRARERAEGAAGLLDRSSRPLSCAGGMGAGWRQMILRLRHCRLTAAEIASRLGLARSTVAAELARLGLGQLAAIEPKAPIRRYQRRRPGDLVHLDIKKLARFDKPGHRVTGSRRGQNSKVGFEYGHVCIDDHSRAAYVEVLDDETGDSCARFLARAVVWFAQQGVTVRRVMTDNGVGYRSHLFRQAWQALGLRHLLTRPYTPKTTDEVEQLFLGARVLCRRGPRVTARRRAGPGGESSAARPIVAPPLRRSWAPSCRGGSTPLSAAGRRSRPARHAASPRAVSG
jgi:transposase InsO family protein